MCFINDIETFQWWVSQTSNLLPEKQKTTKQNKLKPKIKRKRRNYRLPF